MKRFLAAMSASLLCIAFTPAVATTEDESLYELRVTFVDQTSSVRSLDLHRGHPVIVAMFYSSCPNVCPLLIESIRSTESNLSSAARADVRVLLISIDPDRDTPTALQEIAKLRHIDTTRWTLASASADDVRTIAAALDVSYRKLPNGDYNHTSVLTLLSRSGAILKQTSRLGKTDAEFLKALEQATGR
jgi:protein SCO1